MKRIDLTGQVFSRWTVIAPLPGRSWLCRCECGNEHAVGGQNLRKGTSQGCRACSSMRTRSPLRAEVRALRDKGYTHQQIADKLGRKLDGVAKLGHRDGRRAGWMARNFERLRTKKKGPAELFRSEPTCPYLSAQNFIAAYQKEQLKRLKSKLRPRVFAWYLTDIGISAEEIAQKLGISNRQVVRYRGISREALNLLTCRQYLTRGWTWPMIRAKLGRPFGSAIILRAVFELHEEAESEFS
jgi:hypothetical protein